MLYLYLTYAHKKLVAGISIKNQLLDGIAQRAVNVDRLMSGQE